MLKITRIGGEPDQTLKLEGKLLEPWVGEVLGAVAELNDHSGHVRLDLAAVTFVDPVGIHLLRNLSRQGIDITAGSAFVAELLHEGTCRGHHESRSLVAQQPAKAHA